MISLSLCFLFVVSNRHQNGGVAPVAGRSLPVARLDKYASRLVG